MTCVVGAFTGLQGQGCVLGQSCHAHILTVCITLLLLIALADICYRSVHWELQGQGCGTVDTSLPGQ